MVEKQKGKLLNALNTLISDYLKFQAFGGRIATSHGFL